ncbi:hypothetical protein CRYUN_Cryun28dG0030500 [Craigia yunnanensis]
MRINIPSADHQVVKLIGLTPSVQRFMIYQQGCFAGGTALRLAKDRAEKNAAIFGDGAAAAIVGAGPDTTIIERPLFQIVSAIQTVIPD